MKYLEYKVMNVYLNRSLVTYRPYIKSRKNADCQISWNPETTGSEFRHIAPFWNLAVQPSLKTKNITSPGISLLSESMFIRITDTYMRHQASMY